MVKNDRKVLGRGLRALISPDVSGRDRGLMESGLAIKATLMHEMAPRSAITNEPVQEPAPLSVAGVVTDIRDGIVRVVPVLDLFPNANQPRKVFTREDLDDLTASIERVGILQPIVVRKVNGQLEIIAGERRWRAAQEAGLTEVPVVIKDLQDSEAFQISLIENIQRQQLNPIEEARAYLRLTEEFGLTQEEISRAVGKKRASIANTLRLLALDDEVLQMVEREEISQGHAKVILGLKDKSAQKSLAKKCVLDGLSVRAVEKILPTIVVLDRGKALKRASELAQRETFASGIIFSKEDPYPEVVDRLRAYLGTKITIKPSEGGGGRLVVEYFSEEELTRLVEVICTEGHGYL